MYTYVFLFSEIAETDFWKKLFFVFQVIFLYIAMATAMTMADNSRRSDSSYAGPVPPRWLLCPRKGRLIANTFLPVKTPLGPAYDSQVPEEHRFSPLMLISEYAQPEVRNLIILVLYLLNNQFFHQ